MSGSKSMEATIPGEVSMSSSSVSESSLYHESWCNMTELITRGEVVFSSSSSVGRESGVSSVSACSAWDVGLRWGARYGRGGCL